jgi:hypothetical protein
VLHEGRWNFEVNDEDHDPFCTQTAAIRAAVDAAHIAGEKSGDAQVLVQRGNNEFRTEWTYGRDPYPPRAVAGATLDGNCLLPDYCSWR